MTDHEELLANIRQYLDLIEIELASSTTPKNIKNFAQRSLYMALGQLQTYSMFQREMWTAHQMVLLEQERIAAGGTPRPIIIDKSGGAS